LEFFARRAITCDHDANLFPRAKQVSRVEKNVQTLLDAEIAGVNGQKIVGCEMMFRAKLAAHWNVCVRRQYDGIRKKNQPAVRHAFATKYIDNFPADPGDACGVFVSKRFEPIQSARKQTCSQHAQTNRRVRLQILHMKYKWRALERCDQPSCCAEKQRR